MQVSVCDDASWLWPDIIPATSLPLPVHLYAARGGRAAMQVYVNGVAESMEIHLRSAALKRRRGPVVDGEIFQLLPVKVHMNTAFRGFTTKDYSRVRGFVTRRAPFSVFDAMRPSGGPFRTEASAAALYVRWQVPLDVPAGRYRGCLELRVGDETFSVPVELDVADVTIPARGTLHVTNWFNLSNMAGPHGLKPWSEKHWVMIEKYARLMRSARQNHFWVPRDTIRESRQGRTFTYDFSRARRLIQLFFKLGFQHLEGPHVAGRKRFHDSHFVIRGGDVRATRRDGVEHLRAYLAAWGRFLDKNGWKDRALQYVGDEPIPVCAKDYCKLAAIVRSSLPGVPLIDAIEYVPRHDEVDICVPKPSYYEAHRDGFERFRQAGHTLWFYTCCMPGCRHLNRLLDLPLIRTRLLHWGNYLYDLPGYLHWGFNMQRPGDPFDHTPPPVGKTFLPAGDTHIVYPGPDGPWPSVRLEAMGAGIEDYELLAMACERVGRRKIAPIVRRVIRSFTDYTQNPKVLHRARQQILDLLGSKRSE